MSFILDALNKSETNRADRLSATQAPRTPSPLKQHRSMQPAVFTVVAVLLATAFSLWLWLQPQQQVAPGSTQPLPAPEEKAPANQTSIATTPAWERTQLQAQQLATSPDINKQADNEPLPLATPDERAVLAQKNILPQAEPEQLSGISDNIPTRQELSGAKQASLPALHIDGHIYDPSPSRRMIIINGEIAHEKQRMDNGILVEEITPTGAILNHHGTVFHIATFDKP